MEITIDTTNLFSRCLTQPVGLENLYLFMKVTAVQKAVTHLRPKSINLTVSGPWGPRRCTFRALKIA